MGSFNPDPTLSVLLSDNSESLETLCEIADFWKIAFSTRPSNHGRKSVLFYHGNRREIALDAGIPTVICPAGSEGFRIIAKRYGLQVQGKHALVEVPISKEAKTFLRTNVYEFHGENLDKILTSSETCILSRLGGTNVYLLSIDIVEEYKRHLYLGLEDSPSLRFRIVTRMPLSYHTTPKFIRDKAFKSQRDSTQKDLENLSPVESLRTLFLASVVLTAKSPIPRIRFWRRQKTYAAAITHDVETRAGLETGASILLDVEEELKISSTWNVPSARYPLSRKAVNRLAQSGEVCAHDTSHDGRLVLLSSDRKVTRLKKAKTDLEDIIGRNVKGFRAPLLQHSGDLLAAVGSAGYEFDSSVPSWEPLSPTSLRPHGVGTVFPFLVKGVLEIPVSLLQDHQLLKVVGMKVSEAVDYLMKTQEWIRCLGGVCVLLIHPDYDFALPGNRDEYERLLRGFISDPKCDLMTLSQLAEWWRLRANSMLTIDRDTVSIVEEGARQGNAELGIQWVMGYGPEGFEVRDAQ